MTKHFAASISLIVLFLFILPVPVGAQDETPTAVTDQNRTGDLPFSSVVGTDTEHVVVATGNLIVTIPILHVKGRAGADFDFTLRYDGRLLVAALRGPQNQWVWNFENRNYVPSAGIWQTNQPVLTYMPYNRTACGPGNDQGPARGSKSFMLQDSQGAKHSLQASFETAECVEGGWTYSNSGPDMDDSGYWATMSTIGGSLTTLRAADGTALQSSGVSIEGFSNGLALVLGGFEDSNGNITNNYPGGQDTLGRALVTQTNGTNQITYTIHASDGSAQNYTVNYSNLTVHSAFNWGTDYNGTRPAVTSIVLPNGKSYTFGYDNYGGLTSLTFPTGASVTYGWANFGTEFGQYHYVTSRAVTVNGVTSTWTFTQTAQTSGCPDGFSACTAILETDPLGHQTAFIAVSGQIYSASIYNGAAGGTPLRSYTINYEFFPDNSSLPSQVITTLENNETSEIDYTYDSFYVHSNFVLHRRFKL